MKGHGWGTGSIRTRGDGVHQLRYSIGGRRFTSTFHGTKAEARVELRRLMRAGDTGEHIDPNRMTLAQWAAHWCEIGCPGRRRLAVSQRTKERYQQLLAHILAAIGDRPLQRLAASDIDAVYVSLAEKLAPGTVREIHTTLGACLGAAVRTKKLARSPILDIAKAPSAGEADHGQVLDAEQLRALIEGFRGSALFSIVATLAYTGARRNEVLALRWSDLDVNARTLRIERAIDMTRLHGLGLKLPKTGTKGQRTITIDHGLVALLVAERERHLRIAAGVPDGADINLALVKLPDGALMFPAVPVGGDFSFTALREPRRVTEAFTRKATRLGFPDLRLHDLRGSHATLLLDAGVPVHTVASRCGHDPAVLLRSYAKRTKKSDASAAEIIGALSRGVLKT
jgi:integrase